MAPEYAASGRLADEQSRAGFGFFFVRARADGGPPATLAGLLGVKPSVSVRKR